MIDLSLAVLSVVLAPSAGSALQQPEVASQPVGIAPGLAQTPASMAPSSPATLAFISNGDLFTIQPDGSNRQRLADFDDDSYISQISWAPDGASLATVYNYSSVYTVTPGAAAPQSRFTSDCPNPPDLNLAWATSPLALLIRQRCPLGTLDRLNLWIASGPAPARSLATLPEGITSGLYPSPDGSRVAYTYNQHLYVAALDGASPQRLTASPGVYSSAGSPLAWSPDGRQIAFFEGTYPNQKLNLIDADGANQRVLTPAANFQIYRSRLLWAPDGRSIAFYVPYNPPYSNQEVVTVVDVASGESKAVTRPGFYDGLSWSPDSRTLAFAAGNPFESQAVFAFNLDSEEFQPLSPEPVQQILEVAWSADGNWVAYTAAALGELLGNQQLYAIRRDGTGLQVLTGPDEYVYPFAWRP